MTTDKPTVYDDSSEHMAETMHIVETIEAMMPHVTDEMVSAAKLVLCGADPDIDAGIAFLERIKGRDIVREALETALEARVD